ncbi:MAG TPA: hypothetical protein VFN97_02505 [Actinospica sp.]|nr:hypothetical protein [Actinospica sp.]
MLSLTLDKYGDTGSRVYGAVGNVTIIVHCYTPAKLDRAALLVPRRSAGSPLDHVREALVTRLFVRMRTTPRE